MTLAALHPQVVHFVIGLLVLGVLFRWLSLTGRLAFTDPGAAVLLLLGTLAAVVAVKSGNDAHGPVERIPGARAAVEDHQRWGVRTRNIFLGVAVLEILALGLARTRRPRPRAALLVASAVVGLGGAYALYRAADKGGALVYSYAGGVGTRSGNPEDVDHLLLAGLYQQALLDRRRGDGAAAARLIAQLAERHPLDTAVRLLTVESLIVDRKDGKAALAALAWFRTAPDARSLRLRIGILRADAYAAAGMSDSAKAVLQVLSQQFAASRAITERLANLR